jgi:hypothetical protein
MTASWLLDACDDESLFRSIVDAPWPCVKKNILGSHRPAGLDVANKAARGAGGLKPPPIGGTLKCHGVYNILIAQDDKGVFQALIDWVMTHQGQSYDALADGITHGAPLCHHAGWADLRSAGGQEPPPHAELRAACWAQAFAMS